MEFPRQEYWIGLPLPSPGDLPDPGIEPESPLLQADSLPSEPPGKPTEGSEHVLVKLLSPVQLFATLWTIARQAPLSIEFFRQEYWSELPFPFPEDFLGPGIEPTSPALADRFFTTVLPGKHCYIRTCTLNEYNCFTGCVSFRCTRV